MQSNDHLIPPFSAPAAVQLLFDNYRHNAM